MRLESKKFSQALSSCKCPISCTNKCCTIGYTKTQAQYMKNDPNYLSCKKKECKTFQNGKCDVSTCSGSLQFHVINIRSDIEFVFFSGGFVKPCLVGRSTPVSFANPKRPLYGHISSIDSTGTSVSSNLLFLLLIFSVHLFLISNVIWCCR